MTLVTYPLRAVVLCALWLLAGPAVADVPPAADGRFTVAVIPDSQNYLDYKHQRATGFPIDAAEMFHDQVDYIARNVESAGGEIAFVTHVGDVWQHATQGIDAAHLAMGLREDPESIVVRYYAPDPRALKVEARAARDVFTKLADRGPFSVVPGNHDYDGFWADSRFAGGLDPRARAQTQGKAGGGRTDGRPAPGGDAQPKPNRERWRGPGE